MIQAEEPVSYQLRPGQHCVCVCVLVLEQYKDSKNVPTNEQQGHFDPLLHRLKALY